MEAEALHTAADHAALALADAESYRFVEGWHAWRVGGKWFMLASEYKGQRVLILKAPPEDVAALQEGYADIGPAYHMNKKHWYTVFPGASITEQLITELVQESYVAVVKGMPKAQRPAGWQEAVK
ncbi:MmcQ/YjbR family DNA-binding protein [Corynebacterium striatum]|uniref:MmcQ/YjbR family DNA-binding protein n=1 Tax=Corynebacterium striatum TaxID=43770 RepID=UPI000C3A4F80|nr:MmcQ/YjbR family DNA-binding protein [Corynebacterium striatum]MBD0855197.1 cytoplasmic protein [Corynebacterium striatum]MCG7250568.1 MmcQ/YjbR family DNA-binding protein [Corynebacterium striatum]PIS64532.1 hypothetical protein AZH45_03720 [Corynebacterium striatum]PXY03500.1 hypothetical protein CKF53_13405 [Corynebacterium striatum]PXY10962.1 hypothetical protein CKF74_12900 [Corynebacterium striatum]